MDTSGKSPAAAGRERSAVLVYTTRYRPTPTADLPLGHVLVIYENWSLAKRGGGEFTVQFDTLNCEMFRLDRNQGVNYPTMIARYLEDLEWLGCPADRWCDGFTHQEAHRRYAAKLGIKPCQFGEIDRLLGRRPEWECVPQASPLGDAIHNRGGNLVWEPFYQVAKVVDDHEMGVTAFFRGDDLASEEINYAWLCWQLGFPEVKQGYLACIAREHSDIKLSKSLSATPVRELRDSGYTPEQIIFTLLQCVHVSKAQQKHFVMIPEGVLEPGEVKVLPYHLGNFQWGHPDYPHYWTEQAKVDAWLTADPSPQASSVERVRAIINGFVVQTWEITSPGTAEDNQYPWRAGLSEVHHEGNMLALGQGRTSREALETLVRNAPHGPWEMLGKDATFQALLRGDGKGE